MNHLKRAHAYWKEILEPGDIAIDATCGNGHDTLFLSELGARVIAYDIQKEALDAARQKVNATFRHQSHARFEETEAALIVYNLGYLPGGDKSLTTRVETTLKSVEHALKIATKAISITCYPGHPEGAREEEALLNFLKDCTWNVCHHRWITRPKAPSLLWLVPPPS